MNQEDVTENFESDSPVCQERPTSAAGFERIANPHLQIAETKRLLAELLVTAAAEQRAAVNRQARRMLETSVALADGMLKALEQCERGWAQKGSQICRTSGDQNLFDG